jgi:ATP-dependent helicase/DNAse subunit B
MTIEVTDRNSVDELTKLALMDLSYSRIDTYKMCPSKYFYSYITKEPRSFNDAAVLGNIVHAVLEDEISADKKIEHENLIESYKIKSKIFDPSSNIKNDLMEVRKYNFKRFL